MSGILEFKGTALRSADIKEKKVLTIEWHPRMEYAWDNGVALGRYLKELKNGKIIARKCNKCRRIMLPPRMFCELCFRPTDEWVYLQDRGVVNTFAIAYIDVAARRIKEPVFPAVIGIEGASELMGIYHFVGEVDPKEIKIGMKVKAVWKDPEERIGAITDIKYFKPE